MEYYFRLMLRHKIIFPGLMLCLVITGLASVLQYGEIRLFGRAWLEGLVLAILLGLVVRAVWTPGPLWQPGIRFSAKTLLEMAVALLGAGVSATTVLALGPRLLAGIVTAVTISIFASYFLCRGLGLAPRLSLLVACGNSICGNSAIAAVAPVIGADADEVASSIAFTAVLGVVTVLALPLLVPMLHLTQSQYGVLAGLTVYAVPQVLAATLPIGALANQIGTVVKLVRVLMLGPLVAILAVMASRLVPDQQAAKRRSLPPLHHMLPWFIVAFLALLGLRSAGLIPGFTLTPIKAIATLFTTVAMAALGLGVDVRSVIVAGPRVSAAVTLSLLVLIGISLGLIRLLRIL
jgi:uncharacterized integral membrane protein (TIGR00698 family)